MPECGNFSYEMTRKRVKNISMRITADGRVLVTLPMHVSVARAEQFVRERRHWVEDKLRNAQEKTLIHMDELVWTKDKQVYLEQLVAQIYPSFADFGIPYPQLKFRRMRGCYGNCRKASGIVTLNKVMADLPVECAEYVIVHELSHLVEANHSRAFYHVVASVMPDYKLREKELHNYALLN